MIDAPFVTERIHSLAPHEIDEGSQKLKLWVRRKRGNRKLVCSGCDRRVETGQQWEETLPAPALNDQKDESSNSFAKRL